MDGQLAPIQVRDSRRLTGPHRLGERPGAVIDVVLERGAEALIDAWTHQARRTLDAVGWHDEEVRARVVPDGASLVISAPIDALYAATEVNEWALAAAEAVLEGGRAPSLDEAAEKLIPIIQAERNPALLALRDEAGRRGVAFLSDDDFASVGFGSGSQTWPVTALPAAKAVEWGAIHDVPVALVTGTNGKTTTIRLLASIAAAAGQTSGNTSTDGIVVGDELVEAGDYSGPGGARKTLRDQRVDVAFLETARGGMLRRGLPVARAQAALVTNVAADHLGEFGVHDVRAIAETKLIVARAIAADGTLVLNADDALLGELGAALDVPIAWFSIEPGDPDVQGRLERAAFSAVLADDRLALRTSAGQRTLLAAADLPIAFGGAARHNLSNALAAIAVAHAMGYSDATIGAGLRAFDASAARNPGRSNVWDLGGVRVIVDFAHNPHGLAAMVEMARKMPAERRLITLGQAGDRDDASIRELVRTGWQLQPDRVIVKGMTTYLRGRPAGEIPALIERELRQLGAAPQSLVHVDDEVDVTREALRWARAGDLLLVLIHGERGGVLGLLERLDAEGWTPGDPIA